MNLQSLLQTQAILLYVKKIPCSFRSRYDGVMFRMARHSNRLVNTKTGDFELDQHAMDLRVLCVFIPTYEYSFSSGSYVVPTNHPLVLWL